VANPALSSGELLVSLGLTVLSLLLPVIAGLLVLGLLWWALRRLTRARRARAESPAG
jgi:cbb3-type cytochrome oxidase subunit 3